MFNKEITNIQVEYHEKEHVPYVKEVHEFRAPTDESIKILDEMHQKVKERFIKQFDCPDNLLKVNFILGHSMNTLGYDLICRFTINGENHSVELNINPHYDQNVVDKVIDAITKKIAVTFFTDKSFRQAFANMMIGIK